ncbi:MAG: hypothetical protein JJ975_00515 [Bacteroidia bacterium]|nr:hypothetical protein [Bacteroidia bacterium]
MTQNQLSISAALLVAFMLVVPIRIDAKGVRDTYALSGVAYHKNQPITNDLLVLRFNKEVFRAQTDSLGNYVFRVPWGLPCKSGVSSFQYKKRMNQMNPEHLLIQWNTYAIKVKNEWPRKGLKAKNTDRNNRDLFFK